MILIVGLGNPGEEYKTTPHNMGFRALDFFVNEYLPREKWKKWRESELLEGRIGDESIILQKPFTYMNNSGIAVKNAMRKYAMGDYANCWVAHDDLDLQWGRVNIQKERNSAGHKGVQSIIDALGTNTFWRFRIGIKPDFYPAEKEDIDAYLTKNPIPESLHLLEKIIHKELANLILQYIKEGITTGDFFFTA